MQLQRSFLVVCVSSLVGLAACSDEPRTPFSTEPSPSASTAQSQDTIPTRSQERSGTFADFSDEALWSYIVGSNNIAVIGLKAPGANRGMWRGKVLLDRSQWEQARQAVLSEQGVALIWADTLLPMVKVRLESIAALSAVRKLPVVDYVEPTKLPSGPAGQWADSGCDWPDWTGNKLYTSNGDVLSESYPAMGIDMAWLRSQGAGTTIGITDTGISKDQPELLADFEAGESGPRKAYYLHTSNVDSPWAVCSHGPRMAGIISPPKNGKNVVGVAWKSNLVSVRHDDEIGAVSSDAAQHGIRMAGEHGSQVIVMAWQSINWLWQVSDEIDYWYFNRNVLFIGAAGTSDPDDLLPNDNVLFPAEHGQVVAVTAVDYPSGTLSAWAHYGDEVEIAGYINHPSAGQFADRVASIGGTSSTSAVIGGVAALIWSRYPGMTNRDVRDRLRWAGNLTYDDPKLGYGVVDANQAVGGFYDLGTDGPTCLGAYEADEVTISAVPRGDGPFSYRWHDGQTIQSATFPAPPPGETAEYRVQVTDLVEGTVKLRSHYVEKLSTSNTALTC